MFLSAGCSAVSCTPHDLEEHCWYRVSEVVAYPCSDGQQLLGDLESCQAVVPGGLAFIRSEFPATLDIGYSFQRTSIQLLGLFLLVIVLEW